MSSFDVRDSLAVIHRPRVLGDIVGNQKNVDIISGFLKRRELVKTWMFAGGSGSGKTTTARLLAMILNCQTWAMVLILAWNVLPVVLHWRTTTPTFWN